MTDADIAKLVERADRIANSWHWALKEKEHAGAGTVALDVVEARKVHRMVNELLATVTQLKAERDELRIGFERQAKFARKLLVLISPHVVNRIQKEVFGDD